jgi:ELWxxDGT repeat protein
MLLRDLYPGPEGSMPSAFTVAGQRLYFTAYEPLHGTELWESDGTAAGTRLVQDIQPGPTGSFLAGMTPAHAGEHRPRLAFSSPEANLALRAAIGPARRKGSACWPSLWSCKAAQAGGRHLPLTE